ncbi:MAG TPA: hypothetical protein VJI75_02705 [Candidatus Nanoarchaeia archaeon]|nr:hypothetical protein [Candidatus Nanoarchaeia archaeon]
MTISKANTLLSLQGTLGKRCLTNEQRRIIAFHTGKTLVQTAEELSKLQQSSIYSEQYDVEVKLNAKADSGLELIMESLENKDDYSQDIDLLEQHLKESLYDHTVSKQSWFKYVVLPCSNVLKTEILHYERSIIHVHLIVQQGHLRTLYGNGVHIPLFGAKDYFDKDFGFFLELYSLSPADVQKPLAEEIHLSELDPTIPENESRFLSIIQQTKGDITGYVPFERMVKSKRVLESLMLSLPLECKRAYSPILLECLQSLSSQELNSELAKEISMIFDDTTDIHSERRKRFAMRAVQGTESSVPSDRFIPSGYAFTAGKVDSNMNQSNVFARFTSPLALENDSLTVPHFKGSSLYGMIDRFLEKNLGNHRANKGYLCDALKMVVHIDNHDTCRLSFSGDDACKAVKILNKVKYSLNELLLSGSHISLAYQAKELLQKTGLKSIKCLNNDAEFILHDPLKISYPDGDVYYLPSNCSKSQQGMMIDFSSGKYLCYELNYKGYHRTIHVQTLIQSFLKEHDQLQVPDEGVAADHVSALASPSQKYLPLVAGLFEAGMLEWDRERLDEEIHAVENQALALNSGSQLNSPGNALLSNRMIMDALEKHKESLGRWYQQLCAYSLPAYEKTGIDVMFPVQIGMHLMRPVSDHPVIREICDRILGSTSETSA